MSRISVHLFDFSSESGKDLATLLTRISRTPKIHRWRRYGTGDVALLEAQRQRANPNLWLLDFVKRREVGPGKLRRDSEIEGFAFGEGENFGEETSALIDVERHWMATQWNLSGVRSQTMVEYLNLYDHDDPADWVLTPKLDPTVEEKLARKGNLRYAEIKVKMTDRVTQVMRDSGVGLGDALVRAARAAQTSTLAVELNMSHDAGFLGGPVARLCAGLAALGGLDVKTVRIKAREGEVGRDEVIDMLEERVAAQYSSRDLEIVSGRYTLESRWRAMLLLHAGWSQAL